MKQITVRLTVRQAQEILQFLRQKSALRVLYPSKLASKQLGILHRGVLNIVNALNKREA